MVRVILLLAVLAYVAIAGFMYVMQRSLQYHPTHRGLTPAVAGLADVADERLAMDDGETISVWTAAAAPSQPTVLFFHGNAGEIGDRAERLAYYRSEGLGTYFVSYRGFGASTGTISEAGFIADALKVYDTMRSRGIEAKDIVVVGESLGTGVAVQLAAQRPVAALALEAPYLSTVSLAAEIYWWLPVRLLMKDTFRSDAFIARVNAPLLVQHGENDRIIPLEHGRSLFDLAPEPKTFVTIPGEGHGIISAPAIWAREVRFFREHRADQ